MNRLTHAEYVESVRRQAATLATLTLEGEVCVLQSAQRLVDLLWEAEIGEHEAPFLTLRGISSQIDHLPLGAVRAHWAPDALAALEPEIESARAWATPQIIEICSWLVRRFGA